MLFHLFFLQRTLQFADSPLVVLERDKYAIIGSLTLAPHINTKNTKTYIFIITLRVPQLVKLNILQKTTNKTKLFTNFYILNIYSVS